MSKVKIGNLIRTVRAGFTKRSPEILLGIGIASGITTTILAVKATPKAIRLIEQAETEKEKPLTTSLLHQLLLHHSKTSDLLSYNRFQHIRLV